jgi:hypothetical protein
MKARDIADHDRERMVWSQPPLSSDMLARRLSAKAANDRFVAALKKAMGQ